MIARPSTTADADGGRQVAAGAAVVLAAAGVVGARAEGREVRHGGPGASDLEQLGFLVLEQLVDPSVCFLVIRRAASRHR